MNEALNETSLESQTRRDVNAFYGRKDLAKEREEREEGIGLAKPKSLEVLTAERGEVYGPYEVNMQGTADQFTGMLRQFYGNETMKPLPDYMAALFMCAVKLNRLVLSPGHQDTHDDLVNYLRFAKELASGKYK